MPCVPAICSGQGSRGANGRNGAVNRRERLVGGEQVLRVPSVQSFMRDEHLAVPYAPPRWLTPANVATVGVTLVSFVLSMSVGLTLAEAATGDASALVVTVSTPCLSFLVVRMVLRATTAPRAVLRCALAPFAGTLNACVLALVAGLHTSDVLSLAVVYGGSSGVLFGAIFAPPLAYAVRLRNRPSHDGADRALVVCGAVLLPIALLTIAMQTRLPLPVEAPTFLLDALVTLEWLSAGAAVAMLVVGAGRQLARHRWVERVRKGIAPGWKIATARPEDATLLPISGSATACRQVLSPHAGDDGTPFRSNAVHAPVALIR